MKLDSPKNMRQVAGMRCRQSPLRGLIGGLILGAVFIGAAFLSWYRGMVPWFVWGGCVALAALIVSLVIADALAKFRPTNWLLWLRPDGLWINLRSYQNRHLPEAATVLHLPYEEVAGAHRHIETWSTPGRGGRTVTRWRLEALELHLVSGDTRKVAEALADERGLQAAIKWTHQSVTVPTPGVVRIAWRGPGNDIVPALARVLNELSRRVEVTEPTRTDRGDWRQMSKAELDELVAQLVRSGDNLEAGALLIRRCGCSATEAHKLVEEQARRV